ncbi:MAG: hypothetical protein ABJE10_19315 [bacterium]
MPGSRISQRAQTVLTLALVGTVALSAMGVSAPRIATPGNTYSLRYTSVPTGTGAMAAAMEAQRASWTGTVVFAAGRGRLDIVEGGQPPMFTKGDYILFDSSDFIVVHPATRTFLLGLSPPPAGGSMQVDIRSTAKNMVVTLDSLGAGETVDGSPTQRYRLRTSYSLTIDLSRVAPEFKNVEPATTENTLTTEYWYADDGTVALNPFLRTPNGREPIQERIRELGARAGAAEFMDELSDKMSVATARLPLRKALVRMTTSTHVTNAAGTGGTDTVFEISGRATTDVDLARLVLPDGYATASSAAADSAKSSATASEDAGAKWRQKPASP